MSENIAVWIDHKEARICRVLPGTGNEAVTLAPHHVHHRHPHGPGEAKEHPEDAKRFFHTVAQSLEGTARILLLGPSTAKLEFLKYVQAHHQQLAQKIIGIETADHPTEGQLLAHAKAYFDRVDATPASVAHGNRA